METKLLKNNTAYIYGDIDGDVYTLKQIQPKNKVDISTTYQSEFPYIVSPHELIIPEQSIKNIRDSIPDFILELLDIHGVIICGGYMYRILAQNPVEIDAADIDLYIVNADMKIDETATTIYDQELTHKIERILHTIVATQRCTSIVLKRNVMEMMVECETTNIVETIKIQIILSIYKSISQIIHGFDIGSCAVAFDGKEVYFTGLAKFAYETGYNIITIDRRSFTFERRLKKYLLRGFCIIMPNFNIDIIKDDNNIYLTNITFKNVKICENAIYVDPEFIIVKEHKHHSDYDQSPTDTAKLKIDGNGFKYIMAYERQIFKSKIYVRPLTNMHIALLNYTLENIQLNSRKELNERLYAAAQEIAARQLDELQQNGFPFKPIQMTTQYYGIFNPIIEPAEMWYGKYYKE
jgi:hypothetical protein